MRRTIVTSLIVVAVVLSVASVGPAGADDSVALLGDSGWSRDVGTWDATTKTGTLTQDLAASVQIVADGVTLDGNGHTIAGSGSGSGVLIAGRAGITVKNLTVRGFSSGFLVSASSAVTLQDNSALNNGYGVFLEGSWFTPCSGNSITRNNLAANYYGVQMLYADDNVLTYNTVSTSTCGIAATSSDNNSVYRNSFVGNSLQACLYGGVGNRFNLDRPTGGNYWSNWTGPDADGDGFVDQPYVFQGGQDDLPRAVQSNEDTVAPTTAIALAGVAGDNGWYRSDVQLTLNAQDDGDGSGVSGTEYSLDGANWIAYDGPVLLSQEGVTTVHYRSTDNAGNVEASKEQAVQIDKTPPEILLRAPVDGARYRLNQQVYADWSAVDAVSGLAPTLATAAGEETLDTSSVGAKTFTVSVLDSAGNQAVRTVTYYVEAAVSVRLLPPLKTDGSGAFKLGSTIPVKFELRDDTGNVVADASPCIYLAPVVGGDTGVEIEGVSSGAANGGNVARYAGEGGQYIFNLSTKGLSKGTWRLNIALGDGSSTYVSLELR